MIDIHNHLIYGVDDGSKSLDLSIKLIKDAVEDGITDIILTPHYMKNSEVAYDNDVIINHFNILKKELVKQDIKMNIYLGNELLIDESLADSLIKKKINSLNNSRYVLVEFPFVNYREEYDEYLDYIKELGYEIIIAHPERYRYAKEDKYFIDRWVNEGYMLQVNQNAFNNKEDLKIIFEWIKQGYVYFVASDAHSEYRPCILNKAYCKVSRAFGKEVASMLFVDNARRVISNLQMPTMPKVKRKFWL